MSNRSCGKGMSTSKDTKTKPRKTAPKKVAKRGKSQFPSLLHEVLSRAKGVKSDGKSLITLDERKRTRSSENMPLTQSLVDPLQVYRFRLGGYTALSRTSGVVNSFLAADPSASGWNSPEWADLSDLFSEFRLVSLSARVTRNYNTGVSVSVFNLAICSNLGTAVNPGSYAACADNADCVLYSYTDASRCKDNASGYIHTMHASQLNWSQVTTPTTAPYAGAPGSIQFYSDNGAASGTDSNIFQIIISGVYDFRVRV